MSPDYNGTVATERVTVQRGGRYKPSRCSICRNFTWFHPLVLKELEGVPEPIHEWMLCKPCYKALLEELNRSSLRSAVRLRIAMGLVAAERSPKAYTSGASSEHQEFDREFAWFTWAILLFALLHLVILLIIWIVPK